MERTTDFYFQNQDVVGFPNLGLEFKIDETAFTVFGIDIKWYGILIAFGMLLAMVYCFRRMKEFGLDSDRAIDAVIGGLVGAIVGARAYYLIFSPDHSLAEFFQFRQGGLAIYGGLIGALLVGGIIAKIRKVKIMPFFDIVSIGFLIGQCIGRWGNFVNKEAFGSLTNLPWGMATYNVQYELGGFSDSVVLAHPCFLYESLWCLLGFFVLHFFSKHRKFDGEVFLAYTAWYGLGRFFIEALRTDSLMLGRLRVSQLLAGLCFVAAIVLILAIRGRIKRYGENTLYCNTDASKALLKEADDRILAQKQKKAAKASEKADAAVKIANKAIKDADKAEKIADKAEKQAEKVEETSEKTEEDDING
ncbi:MAG: prolipoprotein diacylglyceryl transferase [Oscillospiraceae bacterium]